LSDFYKKFTINTCRHYGNTAFLIEYDVEFDVKNHADIRNSTGG